MTSDGNDLRDELIYRLVEALEELLPYSLTGAAARNKDPDEIPAVVHAQATLGWGKLFLEASRDTHAAIEHQEPLRLLLEQIARKGGH